MKSICTSGGTEGFAWYASNTDCSGGYVVEGGGGTCTPQSVGSGSNYFACAGGSGGGAGALACSSEVWEALYQHSTNGTTLSQLMIDNGGRGCPAFLADFPLTIEDDRVECDKFLACVHLHPAAIVGIIAAFIATVSCFCVFCLRPALVYWLPGCFDDK
jgi:hypothetical protein